MYYVYIHTNKINGKKYCGITNNTSERWRNDGIMYKPYKKNNQNGRPFWNAICKYGWDGFKHEIVQEVDTQEEAWEKEKEIIKMLNLTNNKFGYNVAIGGNGGRIYKIHPKGMLNKPQTPHSIKLSTRRFVENNPMTNITWGVTHEHPRGFKGKKHSKESIDKIREKLKGKTFSDERNKKISDTLKGRVINDEHKDNISKTRIEKGVAKGGNNPSAKKVKVSFVDGTEKVFECAKYCRNDLGISQTIFDKCVKGKKPFEVSKGVTQSLREKLTPLVGMTIEYLENTEITE